MTEVLTKLVLDHGLAAVLGLASIAVQLWVAKWLFLNLGGINKNLARLMERNGMDSHPPPVASKRRARRLMPRAPTPLPWKADAPETADNKE